MRQLLYTHQYSALIKEKQAIPILASAVYTLSKWLLLSTGADADLLSSGRDCSRLHAVAADAPPAWTVPLHGLCVLRAAPARALLNA